MFEKVISQLHPRRPCQFRNTEFYSLFITSDYSRRKSNFKSKLCSGNFNKSQPKQNIYQHSWRILFHAETIVTRNVKWETLKIDANAEQRKSFLRAACTHWKNDWNAHLLRYNSCVSQDWTFIQEVSSRFIRASSSAGKIWNSSSRSFTDLSIPQVKELISFFIPPYPSRTKENYAKNFSTQHGIFN